MKQKSSLLGLIMAASLLLAIVLACGPDSSGGSGGAPSKTIVEQEVRKLWEKPPEIPGTDGASTIDIHSVEIGSPRPSVRGDIGNGKPGTMVYPVRVEFTYRVHYRSRTTVNERDWVFDFIIDDFGKWSCGQGSELPQSDEHKPDEPADLK